MNSQLVQYCPALPVLGCRLHQVTQRELAPMAIDLLRNNPAVVVSGPRRLDWELNRQIGKTTVVKNRLMKRLRASGHKVSYLNVQKVVRHIDIFGFSQFDFAPLAKKARAMPDADVHVIDEVQHAFVYERAKKIRREPYEDAIVALWEKAASALERGGHLILVSCYHPYDPAFEDSFYNSTMALFFSSPVLELKPY